MGQLARVGTGKSDADMYMPVKALNQFSTDWRIKVRVTKKYEVKRWQNQRGEGYLQTVDLVDVHGTQIQGTFFNQQVDKFGPAIKENKVYVVSNGSIKLANKKFTSIPNDFCISFWDDTEFQEVPEDAAIGNDAYSFRALRDLDVLQVGSVVDLIGVVFEVGTLGTIKIKQTKEERERRTILLADDSGFSVNTTLWGSLSHLDLQPGNIIALKNCRVSNYQGISMNSGGESDQGKVNLQHPRAVQLKRWFDKKPIAEHLAEIRPLSQGETGRGSSDASTIEEMKQNSV